MNDDIFKLLVGLRVIHSLPSYGSGYIEDAKLENDDQIFVYISFDNGRIANPFSLLKCLDKGLLSFVDVSYSSDFLTSLIFQKKEELRLAEEKRIEDLLSLSVDELVNKAKELRDTISIRLESEHRNSALCDDYEKSLANQALEFYSLAFKKAKEEYSDLQFISFARGSYPGIAGCYRNLGLPEKVIKLFHDCGGIGSPFLSHIFYVSLAAAYADMGYVANGLRYIYLSIEMNGGVLTRHSENVLKRLLYLDSL